LSDLALTMVIAFGLIMISLVGLAIGWLITGKTKVRHCGMNAGQKKTTQCGGKEVSCPVCNPNHDKDDLESNHNDGDTNH
jgi:hypothetical protein